MIQYEKKGSLAWQQWEYILPLILVPSLVAEVTKIAMK